MATPCWFGVVCCLLSFGVHAADLIVNPTKPTAYPSLQAALDAAQPGDRILVEVSDLRVMNPHPTIRKSVTIESANLTKYELYAIPLSSFPGPIIKIESLTPGLPLLFRRLRIAAFPMGTGSSSPIIGTSSALAGEVRFDNMDITWDGGGSASPQFNTTLISVSVQRLWMTGCRVMAADTANNGGCYDIDATSGSNCIRFTGDLITLEDCLVQAGSANYLFKVNCGPIGEWATGGNGGAALFANSRFTFLTRCKLSDGNGGSIQTGAWTVAVQPGRPGVSQLTGSGTLAAYASQVEAGKPGVVAPTFPGPGRGAMTSIGNPNAPLVLVGDARLGGTVNLIVGPSWATPLAVLVGTAFSPLNWSVGTYLLDMSSIVAVVPTTGPMTMTWPVPNVPALVDLLLCSQLVEQGPLRDGNPSAISLRR